MIFYFLISKTRLNWSSSISLWSARSVFLFALLTLQHSEIFLSHPVWIHSSQCALLFVVVCLNSISFLRQWYRTRSDIGIGWIARDYTSRAHGIQQHEAKSRSIGENIILHNNVRFSRFFFNLLTTLNHRIFSSSNLLASLFSRLLFVT